MKSFQEAITEIYTHDDRYHPDAYDFLREALDFTLKRIVETEKNPRHVNGAELMFGFRDYTLNEFGPMSKPLLKEWGITKTRDVGEMVFNLIGVEMFSKEEGDSPKDFDNIYTFKEAFEKPYLPSAKS